MPLLDPTEYDLENAEEPIYLPDGTEAELRILEVTKGKYENGGEYLNVTLDVPKEALAKNFNHFIGLPNRSMDAKSRKAAIWRMKLFYSCFGISLTEPTDPKDDWPGKHGWAILGVRDGGSNYGMQNTISKFLGIGEQ